MKKYLAVVLSVVLLSSCDESFDEASYQIVRKNYPNSKIYSLPRDQYTFIVIDSLNQVLIIRCNYLNSNKISEIGLLKEIK